MLGTGGPGDPAANPAVAPSGTQVGAVVMTDVVIENNEAELAGGLRVRQATSLALTRVTLNGNRATGAFNANPNPTAGYYGCAEIRLFGATNNTPGATAPDPNARFAERGGGNFQNIGTFVYRNSEITGNSAIGTGGLRVGQSGNVILNNLLVANNTATNGSNGGLVVQNNTAVAMDGVDVVNNQATRPEGSTRWAGSGAGIIRENGTATYRNGVVSGNTAYHNEILGLYACRPPYPNNNNPAAPDFWVYCTDNSRTVNLENVAVVGNTVGVGNPTGGGLIVFVGSAGTYSIRNTTISGNTATGQAGLAMFAHHPTVVEATKVNLFNSTIARNTGGPEALAVNAWVPSPNGGNVVVSGKVTVESSVLAGRAPASTVANAFYQEGPVTTFKNTFIENGSGVPAGVCGSNGNLCAVDAMLAPLADNGGLTLTHRPLPGSSLIDAGSNPANLATDQRGYGHARVVGSAADMGAFETNPVSAGSSGSRNYVQKAWRTTAARPTPGGIPFGPRGWTTRVGRSLTSSRNLAPPGSSTIATSGWG